MNVADVGAGTGYFALPMAARVGPRGCVHAVDVQPEMLALLRTKVADDSPVVLVTGAAEATTLPDASQHLVLYANVWHEIPQQDAAIAEAERILQWGGRIAIVDWRPDCLPPPGPPPAHRLSGITVSDALRGVGWRGIRLQRVGAFSYLVTGRKPVRPCLRCHRPSGKC